MAATEKHIEVYQYSPASWWVSYRERRHGKLWRFDTSVDLSEAEAMASARKRLAVSGLPVRIVRDIG